MELIDKAAVVAEMERRIFNLEQLGNRKFIEIHFNEQFRFIEAYQGIIDFINTLEVKESKLPNPRFPHLNNIVDKVFGAGNLESFEYEEAEQLVLLAKEELLKDLEAKEVDLEKELESWRHNHIHGKRDREASGEYLERTSQLNLAKYFFELGLTAAQKGE